MLEDYKLWLLVDKAGIHFFLIIAKILLLLHPFNGLFSG